MGGVGVFHVSLSSLSLCLSLSLSLEEPWVKRVWIVV